MKRPIFLTIILCLFLLFLTGCGAPQAVPDKTIEWLIDDYLKEYSYYGGEYTDYDADVKHDPDRETKTDTVTIDMTITYPHLVAETSYEATYRYDKSKETWDVIRGGEWAPIHVKNYDMTDSLKLWLEAAQGEGFEVTTQGELGADMARSWLETAIGEASSSVEIPWCIQNYADAYGCDVTIMDLKLNSTEESQSIFKKLENHFAKVDLYNVYKFETDQGDNYEYSYFRNTNSDPHIMIIQYEASVFLFYVNSSDSQTRYKMDQVLSQVGFVSKMGG